MRLFLPFDPAGFRAAEVDRYFSNVLIELEQIAFTVAERNRLEEVMLKKFLNSRTRSFFLYHFSALITNAVEAFFARRRHPLILELGCGSGSLSLLFALLGASVIGIDIDAHLISACRKRQAFYEGQIGRLALEFHCSNAFEFPYERVGKVDGIYSLFAFNTIQPSRKLLARILPLVRGNGLLVISDGNMQSLYNWFFRPRNVMTPTQMRAELAANGFRVVEMDFQCVIPPAVVQIGPAFKASVKLEKILQRLRVMQWLGVSYTIVAEKLGESGKAVTQAKDSGGEVIAPVEEKLSHT